ncbi:DEAD/DEAH box helicase [Alkaliphilus pronyensis]|nr:AAA domain-containing protein [Alkaliphilus pronyensis]
MEINAINIRGFIEYFRNTICDSERKVVDSSNFNNKNKISIDDIVIGKVHSKIFDYLYWKKNKKMDEEVSTDDKLEIYLCPIVLSIEAIHGEDRSSLPKNIIPIMISAILNKDGSLTINSEKFPWIPWEYLEPSLSEITIGELSVLDEYLSKYKQPNVTECWNEYWNYCNQLFKAVTGYTIDEYKLDYYVKTDGSYAVLDDEIIGTRVHISKLYDFLLTEDKIDYNKLTTCFCSLKKVQKEVIVDGNSSIEDSIKHIAQVGSEFPLSKSQRESIHYFKKINEGEVLAVNGPPGTGKTTLLHSIIGQLFVEAALKQGEPPVIVAASNNNQAVTNIIDSLGQLGNDEYILAKRWLPKVTSYGMYIASEGKIKEQERNGKKTYHTLTTNGNGFPGEVENKEYIEKAENIFIENYKAYAGDLRSTKIVDCKNAIHQQLKDKIKSIEDVVHSISVFQKFKEYVEEKYKGLGEVEACVRSLEKRIQALEISKRNLTALEKDFVIFRKSLQWYINVLEFIPFIRRKSMIENKLFFAKVDCSIEFQEYFTDKVKDKIADELLNVKEEISKVKEELEKVKKDIRDYNDKWNRIKHHCEIIQEKLKGVNGNYELTKIKIDLDTYNYNTILELLDVTYRYEAFHLAVHYFEAAWLIEVSNNIEENYEDKKSVAKQKAKWKRHAKLTPCFVSTFYMIPKFFSAWQGKEEYLFNFIDLLIVDEAGQVPPEIAAASFTLAQKAVIVGDTHQIEPVWSVTETVDRQNIGKFLALKDQTEQNAIIDYGIAASSGNVMKIAQNLCKVSKYNTVGGTYLTEHKRCIPEIINYCNELAYEGILEPKRENKLKDYPYVHMGHIHIQGVAEKVNTSWKNEIEAQAIVDWILDNKKRIQDYYSTEKGNVPTVSDCVGIVTPFSVQAKTIRKLLKENDMDSITVGTVHKLQGAERNIVIFSTVYTREHRGGYFFDKKPNMLNVAVSRAKDSFLVFGDKEILNKERKKTPSGLLANYVL